VPRLAGFPTDVTVRFDGEAVPARGGEPLAAALLAAGRPLVSRSAKYHRPRGPFCLAGSCGGCAVRADGLPSRRACRTPCRDGLAAESQNVLGGPARRDLLGALDLVTPRGIDHHRLATWSVLANRAAVALSRRLAGVGRLPDVPLPAAPSPGEERFDALVVGAGPAGLAAAEALAEAGRRVLLAEQEPAAGGRLRGGPGPAGDPDLRWAGAVLARVRAAGGEAALGGEVLGLWHDGASPLALVSAPGGIRLVRAARIVLCTGGHPEPPAVAGGDRPGVLAARGAAALLAEHGVVPGRRAAVIGSGDEATRAAERLGAAGMGAEVVAPAEVRRILGRGRVRALEVAGRRLPCDTVIVATPPAPATELARALGAPVRLDPALGTFALAAGGDGRTAIPGLFAAGEVTGPASAARAAEAGRRAGEAARG
jgi:sarcosine oxidase subunit alpha